MKIEVSEFLKSDLKINIYLENCISQWYDNTFRYNNRIRMK